MVRELIKSVMLLRNAAATDLSGDGRRGFAGFYGDRTNGVRFIQSFLNRNTIIKGKVLVVSGDFLWHICPLSTAHGRHRT